MDIEEYKKLARNKIEADSLTRQVRNVIKETKWQKQNMREGFTETFKPLIETQESVKKSIDEQQNKTIAQLQANQLALTQGLNQNRFALTKALEDINKSFSPSTSDPSTSDPSTSDPSTSDPSTSDKIRSFKFSDSVTKELEKSGEASAKGKEGVKPQIAEFTNEDMDKYLLNTERLDILKSYGYDNLPSSYINDSNENINKVIKTLINDMSNLQEIIKNTAIIYLNKEGYYLARQKNPNARIETINNIETFNTISTYYKNLSDIYNYKQKIGSGITLFNNPHQLLDRLELLGGSILAGNNGVIPEFSKIAHLLNQMKVITKKQLNDLLKSYITIR